MPVRSFRLQLNPGQAAEYRRRHDALWPELAALLREAGIEDYRIFLDEKDGALYGVMHYRRDDLLEALPRSPVMQRWWAYMADIMQTHPDHSPVSVELLPVFAFPPESPT